MGDVIVTQARDLLPLADTWHGNWSGEEARRVCELIRQVAATPVQNRGEDELLHLRQTVEYLTGVPTQLGVINDWRAPDVDQAILRCRERGDTDTAHILAQMRLAYRQRDNEAFEGERRGYEACREDAARVTEQKRNELGTETLESCAARGFATRIAAAIRNMEARNG